MGFATALHAFDSRAQASADAVEVSRVAGAPGPGAHVGGVEGTGGGGAGFAEPGVSCAGAGTAVETWLKRDLVQVVILVFWEIDGVEGQRCFDACAAESSVPRLESCG